MPPVRCVPTATARRALEQIHDYKLIDEDDYNWVFAKGDQDLPIILPRSVPFVPMRLMQKLADLLSIPETPEELEAAIAADTD